MTNSSIRWPHGNTWSSLTKSSDFQMKPETCLLYEIFLCEISPFKKIWDHIVCANQTYLDRGMWPESGQCVSSNLRGEVPLPPPPSSTSHSCANLEILFPSCHSAVQIPPAAALPTGGSSYFFPWGSALPRKWPGPPLSSNTSVLLGRPSAQVHGPADPTLIFHPFILHSVHTTPHA